MTKHGHDSKDPRDLTSGKLQQRILRPLISIIDSHRPRTSQVLVLAALVFLLTISLRLTACYYWGAESAKVQTTVTINYYRLAQLIAQEGVRGFFNPTSAMSDPDLLGHPPGYPIVQAIILRLPGEPDSLMRGLQISADALAAVLMFLVAAELLGTRIGITTGVLVSLSPQLSWNSLLLLPDTLTALPLILGIYLALRFGKQWRILFLSGVLIGLSTLLRPNCLLLAPFVAACLMIFKTRNSHQERRLTRPVRALSLLAGAVLVLAPFTIRNAIVFGRIIPLSLGAGQTLLQGIADYDPERRFGIPDTDNGIQKMEAELYNRPDYADTLFGPDGVQRERLRLRRAFSVIRSNPIWFASVMLRRAGSMLRFERVPLISMTAARSVGYPVLLTSVQKLFTTVFMLPLALLGLLLLVLAKQLEKVSLLLLIPVYYLLFQSALHTEYRYIIAMHYFVLAFAATGAVSVVLALRSWSKTPAPDLPSRRSD